MEKKFELLDGAGEDTSVTIGGSTFVLKRLRALRDFGDVKKGDLGGYIEKEENLSHEGNCWVYDSAKVYGNASVYEDATIHENALIGGCAEVYGGARIFGYAKVSGCAEVYGDVEVSDHAEVYGKADIYGNATIAGNSIIGGYDTIMIGYGRFTPNAHISSDFDFIVFDNIGSEHGTLTAFLNKERDICCTRGCFGGTLEEFEKAVKKTHGNNDFAKEYHIAIELIKRRFMGNWEG